MKRYRFRLEPVLQVRRRQEEAARGALAATTAAVTSQEQQLARRTDAYDTALVTTEVRPCADFLFEQSRRSALAAAVLASRTELREAQEQAVRARALWSEAACRVSALERLDDRQRSEHRAQTQKEDELTTDELVVSRHGRSDR